MLPLDFLVLPGKPQLSGCQTAFNTQESYLGRQFDKWKLFLGTGCCLPNVMLSWCHPCVYLPVSEPLPGALSGLFVTQFPFLTCLSFIYYSVQCGVVWVNWRVAEEVRGGQNGNQALLSLQPVFLSLHLIKWNVRFKSETWEKKSFFSLLFQ